MRKKHHVFSRGEQATLERLTEASDAVALDRARLAGSVRRRDLLIAKCRRADIPARHVAAHAGVTNVAVLRIAAAWKPEGV